jgi:hypothetical protein
MMWAVLSVALAAGAGLGLAKLNVWALIPAAIISGLIAVVIGSASGLAWGRVSLVLFAVLTLLQVSYLIGSVLSGAPTPGQVSDPIPAKQELFRTVQKAIAEEMRAYFEPPLGELPPQLRDKMALLEVRS